MIRINLLPYRAGLRKKQILEHIMIFVVAVLVAIMAVVAADVWSTQDLTKLQEENSILKVKNSNLAKKIGELRNLDSLRQEVEDKLSIVDELQAGRFRSLITFDAIAEVMPQNIWLTAVKDKANSIRMNGYGESSQAVANFMRSLQNSNLFDNVKLAYEEQATVEDVNVRKFALTFHRLTLAEQEVNINTEANGGKK